MTIQLLEEWVSRSYDKALHLEATDYTNMAKLCEEAGELASCANKDKTRRERAVEIGDVVACALMAGAFADPQLTTREIYDGIQEAVKKHSLY